MSRLNQTEIVNRASRTYKANPSVYTTSSSSTQNQKKEPWWQKTLNFIARPQRAITGALANITDKNPNTTLLGGVWGGLSGRERKDFDEFLNNVDWKQREAGQPYSIFGTKGRLDLFDLVNFGGNVALDPLTWATLGGSSIVKSGARAMADEAVKQAAKEGVKLSGTKWLKGSANRMVGDAPDLIEEAIKNRLRRGSGARPTKEVLDDIALQASKKAELAKNEIYNAGKAARLRDQNALINFDVPFTNISKSFGKKPSWLQKVDKTITEPQIAGTANMFSKVGGEAATPEEITKLLQNRYEKKDLSNLTMQELNDLQQLDKFVYKTADDAPFGDAVPSSFSEQAMNHLGNYKFQQGSGGTSKLGDLFRPHNPFNARTVFANSDPLLNRSASQYADTKNQILGRTRQVEKDLEGITKATQGLSKEELYAIPYAIEKAFPDVYKDLDTYLTKTVGTTKNKKTIEDVAQFISDRQKYYGGFELSSGLRQSVRENYFPHIQNFDELEKAGLQERIQKYLNDPTIGKFLQQSANNPYAQSRKSFDTLAEVDNEVAKLKNDLSSVPPNSPEYAELSEKVQTLELLFKRDPIEVFEKRAKTAVRSSAMKALLDQYKLDGVILTLPDAKDLTKEMTEKGYKLLTNREAQAIGVKDIIKTTDDVAEGAEEVVKKGSLEKIAIHQDLYDLLKESPRFSQREAVNRAVEMTNVVTNIFKTLYTSLVPKHYFNNLVGNVFNNTMAGVGASSYYQAGKIMQKMRSGTLTAKEQKLVDFALDEGILNQTSFADLVRPEILRKGNRRVDEKYASFYNKIDTLNQKIVDNAVAKKMRQYVGDPSDNITRLAHYIHIYNSTRSVKLASESVRKHLFNYNEITGADRLVKVVLPFWNWMKNNIPLQITKFVTEPRIAAQWQRIQEESFGQDNVENYPGYIQEGFMKMPWGQQTFYNPRVPVQDLTQLADPLKTPLNALTPVAKMPLEFFFNRQIFSENPISYEKIKDKEVGYWGNEQASEQTNKYLRQNLGILGDLWDAQRQLAGEERYGKDWLNLFTDTMFGSTNKLR
jgi:hypothetical protein